MMPELMARVITVWLNSAVPASLKKMGEFQEVIESSKVFCSSLKESSFYSCDELQEWVDNAPKVWLAKCRETALDMIRYNLSQGKDCLHARQFLLSYLLTPKAGLGNPTQVERIETHMVTREEGKELAANGATGDNQDWDSAWSDAEGAGGAAGNEQPASSTEAKEDDGTDAWGWGEEGEEEDKAKGEGEGQEEEAAKADDSSTAEDDSADAWGWGDDQAAEPAADLDAPDPKAAAAGGSKEAEPQTREITVKEIYSISSMPDPVISLVSAILEDGATLTREGFVFRQDIAYAETEMLTNVGARITRWLRRLPASSACRHSHWLCSGHSRPTTTTSTLAARCICITTPCILPRSSLISRPLGSRETT